MNTNSGYISPNREIKTDQRISSDNFTGLLCPHCGGSLITGQVPCPEGKPGCLVIHYGNICTGCGRKYT